MGDLTKPQRAALARLPMSEVVWLRDINRLTRDSLVQRGLVEVSNGHVIPVEQVRGEPTVSPRARWYQVVGDGRVFCRACKRHITENTLTIGMHDQSAIHGMKVAEVLRERAGSE